MAKIWKKTGVINRKTTRDKKLKENIVFMINFRFLDIATVFCQDYKVFLVKPNQKYKITTLQKCELHFLFKVISDDFKNDGNGKLYLRQ